MELAVAVFTCERFNFLQQVLDSLYSWNPQLKEMQLVIADDATNPDDVYKMMKFWPNAHIIRSSRRLGANANIRKMYEYCEKILMADLMLGMPNDFICTRQIDIKPLIKFFDDSTVGQLQFVHWKGKVGDKKRERALKNWTTGKPIETKEPIMVGFETLIEGNWSFNDLPHIIRLNQVDICGPAMGIDAYGDDKMAQKIELLRVKAWYDTGLRNFEIQNQAFFNLDWDHGKRTGGYKA